MTGRSLFGNEHSPLSGTDTDFDLFTRRFPADLPVATGMPGNRV